MFYGYVVGIVKKKKKKRVIIGCFVVIDIVKW